jgi:hypothetical protein
MKFFLPVLPLSSLLFSTTNAYKLNSLEGRSGLSLGQQLSNTELEEKYVEPILSLLKTESASGGATTMLMLEPIYEAILMLRKEGYSPDAVNMMNTLIGMIDNTLAPSLNQSAGNLSIQLSQSYTSGYAACDAQLSSDISNTSANTLFQSFAINHTTCRGLESQFQIASSNCQSQLATMTAQKNTDCNTASTLNGPAIASCAKLSGTESFGNYTARLQQQYSSQYTTIINAIAVCNSQTSAVNTQTSTCSTANTTWSNQRQQCNSIQRSMDTASCEAYRYSMRTCSKLQSCYSQFTSNYNNYVGTINASLAGLRSQQSALLQIKCLLNTLSSTSNSPPPCPDTTALAALAAQMLTVAYPSPVPKAMPICTPLTTYVGTAGYNSTYYSSLPSTSPAASCSASACPCIFTS